MTPELIFDVGNVFVLPFWAIMIVLYIYLFGSSLTPENAAALSNPKLADIAKFLGEETAAATGWIHFLVMEQRTGVWTVHSLALCLFAGPMGLLSHILTAWITEKFFPSSEVVETVTPSV
ncbi:MAG: DUF4281 domain-containing protein [Oscillatoriales cyanobacterium]|nr:MAG: DUF4281 domain-containing protein [Oscillatoriales cyanobacterium]